ncbi:MAG: DinB family protein [Actinomycetota bacterium]
MTERIDPPAHAPEKATLIAFLDYYRASLIIKTGGLTDEQARTASVPPSDLNLMGLVRHMAEVERNWFQRWFIKADAPPIFQSKTDRDIDLHPNEADTLSDTVAIWRREVDRAGEITAAADLDELALRVGTSPHWLGFRPSMRWILVHMIEEYARHCGHADLIREAIDGTTGD